MIHNLRYATFDEWVREEIGGHTIAAWLGTVAPLTAAREAWEVARKGMGAEREAVPPDVYYSPEADNFYNDAGQGMGMAFWQTWRSRSADFPATPDASASDVLTRVRELFAYALPQFNWAVSALDAKAVAMLNEVPGEVERALARTPAAARDVLAERRRQIEREGYTQEHDDGHCWGDLREAAICYAQGFQEWHPSSARRRWPWADEFWKPTNRRRNLVKATALLLAEIERLDRAAEREGPEGDDASR